MRKTKIICTIGPAVNSKEKISALLESGMDAARFNFSHGTHESQKAMMDLVKEVAKEMNRPMPIILDSKGPEIRLKDFKDGKVVLEKGQEFVLDEKIDIDGDSHRIAISYPDLSSSLKKGDHLLINDGAIDLLFDHCEGKAIHTTVVVGGELSNHKSINVPGVSIPMPYLSEADKSDFLFGISQNVDFVAASFVRTKDDVLDLRNFLDANGGKGIEIIAKIENMQGVENYPAILDIADGLMVARGDLGVEIPYPEIPALQREMIVEARTRGKIVVVATQMLESMTKCPRPTRAEVSDVANAVFDGTTAIMLSGESANGLYPIEAVNAMSSIAVSAEKTAGHPCVSRTDGEDVPSTLARAAYEASKDLKCKAIIALSYTGRTAKRISAEHPSVPVIGVVIEDQGKRQLSLYYGCLPIKGDKIDDFQGLFDMAIKKSKETGIVVPGDEVIVLSGSKPGKGTTDSLRIITVD